MNDQEEIVFQDQDVHISTTRNALGNAVYDPFEVTAALMSTKSLGFCGLMLSVPLLLVTTISVVAFGDSNGATGWNVIVICVILLALVNIAAFKTNRYAITLYINERNKKKSLVQLQQRTSNENS